MKRFVKYLYLNIFIADDRFILKQMSRLEVQSFVEFAPGYFQYVTKAFNDQVSHLLICW